MRKAALALLASVGLAAGAAACGDRRTPDGERRVRDSVAAADSSSPGSAAGTADSAAGDRRPLRSRLLRLVNSRGEEVVVHAAAGRGWVVLDTVPAGDSSRVRVESRARKVGLRAVETGRPVAADSVDLTASGPARWRIPPQTPPAPEEGSGGAEGDAPAGQPPSSPRTISMVSVTLK